MASRPITPYERELIDSLYAICLSRYALATDCDGINAAWKDYQRSLAYLSVFPSLSGYRVQQSK